MKKEPLIKKEVEAKIRERLTKSVISFLNFDQIADERWHSPLYNPERYRKVRRDAEKIADIAMTQITFELGWRETNW